MFRSNPRVDASRHAAHVRDVLAQEFRELGLPVEIHAVRNHATSSMRKRTLRLLETIAERAGHGDAPLHLVGHSSFSRQRLRMRNPKRQCFPQTVHIRVRM